MEGINMLSHKVYNFYVSHELKCYNFGMSGLKWIEIKRDSEDRKQEGAIWVVSYFTCFSNPLRNRFIITMQLIIE